jgi:hypothetical protein
MVNLTKKDPRVEDHEEMASAAMEAVSGSTYGARRLSVSFDEAADEPATPGLLERGAGNIH